MSPITFPNLDAQVGMKVLWKNTGFTHPAIASAGTQHFWFMNGDTASEILPDAVGSTLKQDSANFPWAAGAPAARFEINVAAASHLTIEGAFRMTDADTLVTYTSDHLRAYAFGFASYEEGDAHWGRPALFTQDLALGAVQGRLFQLGLNVQGADQNNPGQYVIENRQNAAFVLAHYGMIPPNLDLNSTNRWRIRVGERAKSGTSPTNVAMESSFNVKNLSMVYLAIEHLPVFTTGGSPVLSGEIRAITS